MPRIMLATAALHLSYDAATGVFTWTHRVGNVPAGAVAGSLKNGNRYIRIGEVDFLARRLAWLFVHGEWPTHSVRMLNGDKDDCRASNLGLPVAVGMRGSLSAERLRQVLDYDPATGIFTWKESGHRRAIGSRAGNLDPSGYRIIMIDGVDYMAARLAWLHVHGEWPPRRLQFGDGGTDDCRLDNLSFGAFDRSTAEGRSAYGRAVRHANPDYFRNIDLKRSFGITLEEYQRLFLAQNGVCAICAQPERDTRNGKVKWLAVDHDHETGVIRGLLCVACNTALGKMEDNTARLRAAADYLDRHAAERPGNVVPIRSA